jgi:hypothetical protein
MDIWKSDAWRCWETLFVLAIPLFFLSFLPACDGTGTPQAVQSPAMTVPSGTRAPAVTIKQELEEQLEMLSALMDAEKGRGSDVSQAERQLNEASQALESNDLILAREKLRGAGQTLGVKLP